MYTMYVLFLRKIIVNQMLGYSREDIKDYTNTSDRLL